MMLTRLMSGGSREQQLGGVRRNRCVSMRMEYRLTFRFRQHSLATFRFVNKSNQKPCYLRRLERAPSIVSMEAGVRKRLLRKGTRSCAECMSFCTTSSALRFINSQHQAKDGKLGAFMNVLPPPPVFRVGDGGRLA